MTESVIVAVISGGLLLVGNLISNLVTNGKNLYRLEQLEKSGNAISSLTASIDSVKTDVEIIKINQSNLTEEVRKHNGVVERMFAVEKAIGILEERQTVANKRIGDLEQLERRDFNDKLES